MALHGVAWRCMLCVVGMNGLVLLKHLNWFLERTGLSHCRRTATIVARAGSLLTLSKLHFLLRFFAFVSNFVIFCPLKCLKAWLDVSHGSCVGFDTSLMVSEWRSHKMCPFKDVHCIFPLQKQAFLFPSRKQADISFPPRFFTLFGRPFAMPAWCTSESSTNCALLCSDVGSKPDSLP